MAKDQVCCRLLEGLPGSEPRAKVDLAFGLLKGEKTDFVLQKGTELGVSAFLPFLSSRTVVKVQKDKDSKQKRRQRIVRSAAGQARRSLLPAVREAVPFNELLQRFADYELVLFFWEEAAGKPPALREEIGLQAAAGSNRPGRGLSAEEAGQARKAGAKLFTLGPAFCGRKRRPLSPQPSASMKREIWEDKKWQLQLLYPGMQSKSD